MKRCLMLLLMLAVFAGGCATTQMVKPDQPPDLAPDGDTALLVILRDTYFGGAIVFWNYLDGKFIGETMGNTYIVSEVEPGPHYVVSETENTGIAHLNFEAGKQYFLRQGIAVGIWRARTSGFFPVPAEEAKKAIQECTYLQVDESKTFPDMDTALYQKAIDEYEAGVRDNPEGYKELLDYRGEYPQ